MKVEVVDELTADCRPETEYHHQEHGELVGEVGVLAEHEVAGREEHVLGVEQDVVDEIAEACRPRFQIEIDEYVDEGADKVVKFFKYFFARAIHVRRCDTVVCLEAQDPKVHDQPVSEYYHEEPRTEYAREQGHG